MNRFLPGDMVVCLAEDAPVWMSSDMLRDDRVGTLLPGQIGLVVSRHERDMVKVIVDDIVGYCFITFLDRVRTC